MRSEHRFHAVTQHLSKLAVGLILLAGWTSVHAQDNLQPFTTDSFAEITSEYEGEAFLLSLWSIDCAPCIVDLERLGELKAEYPDLPVVLVSTDPPSERQEAVHMLEDYGLAQYESWIFADDFTERLRHTIDPDWFGELPRSYLYDAGHDFQAHSGVLPESMLDTLVERHRQTGSGL